MSCSIGAVSAGTAVRVTPCSRGQQCRPRAAHSAAWHASARARSLHMFHQGGLKDQPLGRTRMGASFARKFRVQTQAAVACDENLVTAYKQAAKDCGIEDPMLVLRSSPVQGKGLFLTKDMAKDDVLMRIPTDACIIVQRDPTELHTTSWRAPNDGAWNRVESGFAAHATIGLPWDLVCALALVDAAEGNGGSFFGNYQQLLPSIAELQMPFCMRPSVIAQLQHHAVETGARGQKERLTMLFPHLMPDEEDEEEDGPGLLQWAYACVRSRSFMLGNDYFAFIPFLDMANHSEMAGVNAAYRPSPDGETIDVVATADITADSELFISYTGEDVESYTSQRLMAQYGFVLSGGSLADRLPFVEAIPTHLENVTLSLEKLQASMGDVAWVGMMVQKNNHLYAVLKSLPVSEEPMGTDAEQRELAQALIAQCESALASFPTTLEEDRVALVNAQSANDHPLAGAFEFRTQQKILWEQGKSVLQDYLQHGENGESQ